MVGGWLTEREAARLITAAPPHLQPVIQFALATGLRKSNILQLRWANVDLARRQLWVHPDDAKGGKAIGIPLNGLAMQVLNACRGQHTEFVFSVEGRPYRWIDHRTWQRACNDAGVPGLRFHDLLHTWASWLAQAGVDPQHLKTLGGWSTLAMVERYSHLNVEHLQAAAEHIPTTLSLQSEIIDLQEARQRRASR
jgi:integrase